MMSNSLLTYTYIRGKAIQREVCILPHMWKMWPFWRPPLLHRAPRNGSPALHLQCVHRPSLYAAGSVGACDLQRATAQRSPSHDKQAWKPGCLLWGPWGRWWSWKRRWHGHRGFFTFRRRKDGHIRLGRRDLCERSSWNGWEDWAPRDDNSRDLDELLPERQLLLIPSIYIDYYWIIHSMSWVHTTKNVLLCKGFLILIKTVNYFVTNQQSCIKLE